jgi:DeoR family transcriptional regulator, ulaG and ulaABCDEF operon transcriptional repressor
MATTDWGGSMHASERQRAILELVGKTGFVSFRAIEEKLGASPATLRRDLAQLDREGLIKRLRGGAQQVRGGAQNRANGSPSLLGTPFQENITRNRSQKEAIGRAAAALCEHGEGVMIDGGSTTLQMCHHLDGLNLQVLTTSLHIVLALLPQAGTRILMPGGSLFREQDIILSAVGDDLMPRFHAPKLFMGAAAVGPQGVMQADVVLVAAERRLIERADQLILLVDSSKFHGSSGNVVCPLSDVDIVVTDPGLPQAQVKALEAGGIRVIVAKDRKKS